MPEWLTRKVGPLPVWGYALAGVAILFLYRRGKSATGSTTSATPTSANYASTIPANFQEPTASLTEPGGFSYTGPLSGLGALIPTGALAATNGSNTTSGVASNYASETMQGSGYLPGTNQYGQVTSLSGQTYAYLPNADAVTAAIQGGIPTFYQPSPGVFAPLKAGSQGAPGTPTYIQAQ